MKYPLTNGLIASDVLALSSGTTFPDALSGTALVAGCGGATLLVKPTSPPSACASVLSGTFKNKTHKLYVFGGTVAISDSVKNSAARNLQ